MKKLGFDLDGTIYDTLDWILTLDNEVRKQLGYEPISKVEYRQVFQTEDWEKLGLDLGIKQTDIGRYREELKSRINTTEPPALIPGGKEIVREVEKLVGSANLCFVTNSRNPDKLKKRFERDGLGDLYQNVFYPPEGKAETLFKVALEEPSEEFIYIGDLVSDGRACKKARERGAKNLKFCAIAHRYAMNPPQMLHDYTKECPFCICIESLDEIVSLISSR